MYKSNMKSSMLGGEMPVGGERKKPKKPKKMKTQNVKEVNVVSKGRYTDKEQSISKAKRQAKNFSKNESTGYAASVNNPKKVKTITYKDGKKVKTTVAKSGEIVKERGSEVRGAKRKERKELRMKKRETGRF